MFDRFTILTYFSWADRGTSTLLATLRHPLASLIEQGLGFPAVCRCVAALVPAVSR